MSIIAVDFDGTLCESRWPQIGDAHWPILHEIIRRQAEGDKFILWTCRHTKKAATFGAVFWYKELDSNCLLFFQVKLLI